MSPLEYFSLLPYVFKGSYILAGLSVPLKLITVYLGGIVDR